MLVQSWLVGCFGNASEPNTKTVTTDSKLLRTALPSLQCIYRDRVRSKANTTASGNRHPLSSSFKVLPSPRCYCPFFPLNKNRSKQSGQNIPKAQWKCLFVLYVFMYCMFLDCYVLVHGNVMWFPLQSYLSIYKLWMQTTLISPKYNFCTARPHTTSPANHFRLLHFMKERRNWWCTESHDCSWAV